MIGEEEYRSNKTIGKLSMPIIFNAIFCFQKSLVDWFLSFWIKISQLFYTNLTIYLAILADSTIFVTHIE